MNGVGVAAAAHLRAARIIPTRNEQRERAGRAYGCAKESREGREGDSACENVGQGAREGGRHRAQA